MADDGTHIVCPDCGATNRIAAGKDARDGKCGKCGEALFAGPAHADAALFDKQTTQSDVPGRRRLLGRLVRPVPRDGADLRAGVARARAEIPVPQGGHRGRIPRSPRATASAASRISW